MKDLDGVPSRLLRSEYLLFDKAIGDREEFSFKRNHHEKIMPRILFVVLGVILVIFFSVVSWSKFQRPKPVYLPRYAILDGGLLTLHLDATDCAKGQDEVKIASNIQWDSQVFTFHPTNGCFQIHVQDLRSSASMLEGISISWQSSSNSSTTVKAGNSMDAGHDLVLPFLLPAIERLGYSGEEVPPSFLPIRRSVEFCVPSTNGPWDADQLQGCNFVVFGPDNLSNELLMASLLFGAIPILPETSQLPLDEVVDWSKIGVLMRNTHFTKLEQLQRVTEGTILEKRRQGFWAFRAYFSSLPRIMDSIGLVMMKRLGLEPPYYTRQASFDLMADKHVSSETNPNLGMTFDPAESYFLWNVGFHPWRRAPSYIPLSSRTLPQVYGQIRPLEDKYTVVFMTYKRTSSMIELVRLLAPSSRIHKVVVIWNDLDELPPKNLSLPETSFQTHILKAQRNSINNRLIPYDVIETDAILMLDDDTRVPSVHEFDMGFQVWRESPDRLVGISPRSAKEDYPGHFVYDWGDLSQMSISITNAVFMHRYYSYRYTFEMPQRVRDEVDSEVNCEDIFLNGLVADFIGKSPLKFSQINEVTCYSCTNGAFISTSHNHGRRRNECVNMLPSLYGYMPLVSSQLWSLPLPSS